MLRLERIEQENSAKGQEEFLLLWKRAVLAALVESGQLTYAQYRYAEEKLYQRYRKA